MDDVKLPAAILQCGNLEFNRAGLKVQIGKAAQIEALMQTAGADAGQPRIAQ